MARVMLVSTMEKGHTNPLAGVVQHLKARGHTVGWLCVPHPAPQVQALGAEVVPFEPPPAPPFVTGGEALAGLVRDEERLYHWIRTLLLDAVPGMVEPMRAAMRAWRPDVVAPDPMQWAAVLAAHLEKLPLGTISSSLNPCTPESVDCPHTRNMKRLAPDRDALFRRFGVEPAFRICDYRAPRVNVVFACPEYVGALADTPPNVQLVGPSLPTGPRGDEPALDLPADSRPLVYASFGSQIFYQPDIFGRIAEATSGMGVQVLLTAGELADSPWARSLPAHVRAVRYTPQLQVLQRAAAFITHGGANSIMEALWAGVPLLQSPVCNDQFLQAEFLRASGAGTVLDLHTATVPQQRAALQGLLQPDSTVRRALAPIHAAYRRADGARRAAEALEGLLP
ncbi:MAG: glycosyltransferase [Planctomycetes bacterium]|nr:glycosyltransferase [Planctomycetota bacterium]